MKTTSVLLGLLAAGLFSLSAAAESLPSSKATFAYNSLVALQTNCSTSTACDAPGTWTTILRSKLKTANQKDLFIDASLQCGIVTDTTVKSMNGTTDTSEARGTVRVRVKITAPDGTVTYAEPSAGVDATNTTDATTNPPAGIVFCDRIQTLTAKFSGLNCTAAPYVFTDGDNDGVDDVVDGSVTCADPEELQLILKTLNANAFNFVAPNLVSGVHTIDVQAKTSAKVSTISTNGSLGAANAFIGAGSVAVESVRMIKGNDGTTLDF